MAETTTISWCDSSWNPWYGCTKVSVGSEGGGGCDHCYAEMSTPVRVARSKSIEPWGPHGTRIRTSDSTWDMPKRWNRQHEVFFAEHGRRRRVFLLSLGDIFDNAVDPSWRAEVFALIRATPNLDWLVLTKRISNAKRMLPKDFGPATFPHVHLGITVVNQAEADRDVVKLLKTPAAVRFLSLEPLLGPVDLTGLPSASGIGRYLDALSNAGVDPGALVPTKIDWVIVGGESGKDARPMHPDWVRQIRDDCEGAGTAFFMKQWGEWAPHGPESLGYPLVDDVPRRRVTRRGLNGRRPHTAGDNDVWMQRAGVKHTGRLLDGVLHDAIVSCPPPLSSAMTTST